MSGRGEPGPQASHGGIADLAFGAAMAWGGYRHPQSWLHQRGHSSPAPAKAKAKAEGREKQPQAPGRAGSQQPQCPRPVTPWLGLFPLGVVVRLKRV